MTPLVFCVAGTDPSGGAGLAADGRVCAAHGCYGMGVVTAVVAQSTLGVSGYEGVTAQAVTAQWDALRADCAPAAVKVGMLGSAEVARAVAGRLAQARAEGAPVVYDPVLRSGHDAALSRQGLIEAVREALLPDGVDVLTPNVPEAQALLGVEITSAREMMAAAARLQAMGPRGVLLKGGHLDGSGDAWAWQGRVTWLANEEVWEGLDVHGTGCHLSTALACALARAPQDGEGAARAARAFLAQRLRAARWRPGRGREVLG